MVAHPDCVIAQYIRLTVCVCAVHKIRVAIDRAVSNNSLMLLSLLKLNNACYRHYFKGITRKTISIYIFNGRIYHAPIYLILST